MANGLAVITKSGFGKSTSLGHISKEDIPGLEQDIEGLNPAETLLINVKGKSLPFRGWKNGYSPIPVDVLPQTVTGNYLRSADAVHIINTLNYFNTNRPEVKNVVIDDFQYIMAEEFVAKARIGGYDKFALMAQNAYYVINTGINMRPDVNFIILTHADDDGKGSFKMKTIGKMLDEKVTLEGLFTVILYGKESYDTAQKRRSKTFVTNYDGEYPAKSPVGMFKDLYIPNDLGLVIKTMNGYYNGE